MEEAGLERPYRIQSLLGRGSWSADAPRDLVRGYVAEALGDQDGVARHPCGGPRRGSVAFLDRW